MQSRLEEAEANQEQEERDFKRNLLEALDSMGHLTPKIWKKEKIEKESYANDWKVSLAIGERKYTVKASFDGSEIFEIEET